MPWNYRFLFVLILALGTSHLASAVEVAKTEDPTDPENVYANVDEEYVELIQLFADTLDQVDRNYVNDVDRRALMEAAIRGVISKLDPYSNYIAPEDLERFKTGVESEFGGIGIQVSTRDGQLVVTSPLFGTPAYEAGIIAGDRITHIEGEETKGLSIDDAIKRLKGPIGTEVTMTVYHPSTFTSEKVSVRREMVQIETVLGDERLEGGNWDYMFDHADKIGYVRVSAFSRHTADDLHQAITRLLDDGMKGLVLDLRSNPGGLLTSAVEICDMFIEEGKIVSTEGRNSPKRVWTAEKDGTLPNFPMVILIDHYSASASEILSACLQDHGRATIVGERSWGKGSVQNIIELEEGKSALKLTTAGYQRPSGEKIHRFEGDTESDKWGVSPDDGMDVKMSREQKVAYHTYRRLRDQDTIIPHPPAPQPKLSEIDPVLSKGLEHLKAEISSS
ncbi:Carboxy-terminal processing protease CtpB precursor [Bremerella volcania]|uniref:Carboxy-terminal processing protease CtpB n=1 Tax=Bremerella volcania TaxID=2527984 RepID=A0A518CBM3_9BACT|nr:S41 family peptidase [Bremerella volcania]QDU76574.1 Carboxy-terminal processing protease CtpB precursor [Bremerella volcania]